MDLYFEFKEWYLKILRDFNFDYQKDCESRDYLSQLLKIKSNWNLEKILISFKMYIQEKKNLFIYGCGPSLEETVDFILKDKGHRFFDNCINLCADGASRLLYEKKISVDAIFTDLDGITKKMFNHSRFIIVHAHGDNLIKLKHFKKEIIKFNNIVGTTQVEPILNVINTGGFTDGDRILFFLKSLLLPNHELFLIGMDFKDIIGKYSKFGKASASKAEPIKIKKLQYAVKLIEWLSNKVENKLFFVNSDNISKNFRYLSLRTFLEMF